MTAHDFQVRLVGGQTALQLRVIRGYFAFLFSPPFTSW